MQAQLCFDLYIGSKIRRAELALETPAQPSTAPPPERGKTQCQLLSRQPRGWLEIFRLQLQQSWRPLRLHCRHNMGGQRGNARHVCCVGSDRSRVRRHLHIVLASHHPSCGDAKLVWSDRRVARSPAVWSAKYYRRHRQRRGLPHQRRNVGRHHEQTTERRHRAPTTLRRRSWTV